MSLEKRIENLTDKNQISLAIRLLEIGIVIWNEFAKKENLTYKESVIGTTQTIRPCIVARSITNAKLYIRPNWLIRKMGYLNSNYIISKEFLEPITALQDLDWEIPNDPKLIFYSAYNLIETICGKRYTGFNELTIFVSINQSIEAIENTSILSVGEIKSIISSFEQ